MDRFEAYYTRAIKFLAIRPRSEKEVRDNLAKKKAPQDIVEKIIEILTKQKFLNDFEFARWWIDQRSKFRPRSIKLLKLELLQKGVDKEVIDTVLSDRTNEELKVNDLDSAKALVQKKMKKFANAPREEIYQKIGGFLARRGYSWDTIKQSIDEVLELEYNRD